jgi:hypothetical protein
MWVPRNELPLCVRLGARSCVRARAREFACTHARTYTHAHTHTRAHACTRTRARRHARTHAHTRTRTHTHTLTAVLHTTQKRDSCCDARATTRDGLPSEYSEYLMSRSPARPFSSFPFPLFSSSLPL